METIWDIYCREDRDKPHWFLCYHYGKQLKTIEEQKKMVTLKILNKKILIGADRKTFAKILQTLFLDYFLRKINNGTSRLSFFTTDYYLNQSLKSVER